MTTRNAATLLSCLEPHPGLYGEFLKYIHTGELKPQRDPLRSGVYGRMPGLPEGLFIGRGVRHLGGPFGRPGKGGNPDQERIHEKMRLNAMTGMNYTELRPKAFSETPEETARKYASLDRTSYGMFPGGKKPYEIPGGSLLRRRKTTGPGSERRQH